MVTKKIGTLKLKLYNSIEELPSERHHLFNKYALLEAGIGSSLGSIQEHIKSLYAAANNKDNERMKVLLQNYYMSLNYTVEDIDLVSMCLCCKVYSINGKKFTDLSEESLIKLSSRIRRNAKFSQLFNLYRELKKKLRMKSKYISPLELAQQKQRVIINSLKGITS